MATIESLNIDLSLSFDNLRAGASQAIKELKSVQEQISKINLQGAIKGDPFSNVDKSVKKFTENLDKLLSGTGFTGVTGTFENLNSMLKGVKDQITATIEATVKQIEEAKANIEKRTASLASLSTKKGPKVELRKTALTQQIQEDEAGLALLESKVTSLQGAFSKLSIPPIIKNLGEEVQAIWKTAGQSVASSAINFNKLMDPVKGVEEAFKKAELATDKFKEQYTTLLKSTDKLDSAAGRKEIDKMMKDLAASAKQVVNANKESVASLAKAYRELYKEASKLANFMPSIAPQQKFRIAAEEAEKYAKSLQAARVNQERLIQQMNMGINVLQNEALLRKSIIDLAIKGVQPEKATLKVLLDSAPIVAALKNEYNNLERARRKAYSIDPERAIFIERDIVKRQKEIIASTDLTAREFSQLSLREKELKLESMGLGTSLKTLNSDLGIISNKLNTLKSVRSKGMFANDIESAKALEVEIAKLEAVRSKLLLQRAYKAKEGEPLPVAPAKLEKDVQITTSKATAIEILTSLKNVQAVQAAYEAQGLIRKELEQKGTNLVGVEKEIENTYKLQTQAVLLLASAGQTLTAEQSELYTKARYGIKTFEELRAELAEVRKEEIRLASTGSGKGYEQALLTEKRKILSSTGMTVQEFNQLSTAEKDLKLETMGLGSSFETLTADIDKVTNEINILKSSKQQGMFANDTRSALDYEIVLSKLEVKLAKLTLQRAIKTGVGVSSTDLAFQLKEAEEAANAQLRSLSTVNEAYVAYDKQAMIREKLIKEGANLIGSEQAIANTYKEQTKAVMQLVAADQALNQEQAALYNRAQYGIKTFQELTVEKDNAIKNENLINKNETIQRMYESGGPRQYSLEEVKAKATLDRVNAEKQWLEAEKALLPIDRALTAEEQKRTAEIEERLPQLEKEHEAYTAQYNSAKAVREYDETVIRKRKEAGEATDRWKTGIYGLKTELAAMIGLEKAEEINYQKLTKEQLRNGAVQKNLKETMDLVNKSRENSVKIQANEIAGLEKNVSKVLAMQKQEAGVSWFDAKRLKWFATLRAYWLGYSVVSQAMQGMVQFEQEMANVGAVSNSTEKELNTLKNTVLELGTNYRYSAAEIAKGLTIIAQAGFSAREANSVIVAATQLAAGTLSDMSTTANILTTVIRAWNRDASEATKIADSMAAAINQSKLSMDGLVTSFNYVSAAAPEVGLSLEGTLAALAQMSNAGLNASIASTSLRAMLSDLMAPNERFTRSLRNVGLTISDVSPMVNSFGDILKKLKDAGFDVNSAFEGLERRAATGIALMIKNADSYEEMTKRMYEMGAAQRMAEQNLNTLDSAWKQFNNTLTVDLFKNLEGGLGGLQSTLRMLSSMISDLSIFVGAVLGPIMSAFSFAFKQLDSMGATAGLDKEIGILNDRFLTLSHLLSETDGKISKVSDSFSQFQVQVFTKEFGIGMDKYKEFGKDLGDIAGQFKAMSTAKDAGVLAISAEEYNSYKKYIDQMQELFRLGELSNKSDTEKVKIANDLKKVSAELNTIVGKTTERYRDQLAILTITKEMQQQKVDVAQFNIQAQYIKGMSDYIDELKEMKSVVSFLAKDTSVKNFATSLKQVSDLDLTAVDRPIYVAFQARTNKIIEITKRLQEATSSMTYEEKNTFIKKVAEKLGMDLEDLKTKISYGERLSENYDALMARYQDKLDVALDENEYSSLRDVLSIRERIMSHFRNDDYVISRVKRHLLAQAAQQTDESKAIISKFGKDILGHSELVMKQTSAEIEKSGYAIRDSLGGIAAYAKSPEEQEAAILVANFFNKIKEETAKGRKQIEEENKKLGKSLDATKNIQDASDKNKAGLDKYSKDFIDASTDAFEYIDKSSVPLKATILASILGFLFPKFDSYEESYKYWLAIYSDNEAARAAAERAVKEGKEAKPKYGYSNVAQGRIIRTLADKELKDLQDKFNAAMESGSGRFTFPLWKIMQKALDAAPAMTEAYNKANPTKVKTVDQWLEYAFGTKAMNSEVIKKIRGIYEERGEAARQGFVDFQALVFDSSKDMTTELEDMLKGAKFEPEKISAGFGDYFARYSDLLESFKKLKSIIEKNPIDLRQFLPTVVVRENEILEQFNKGIKELINGDTPNRLQVVGKLFANFANSRKLFGTETAPVKIPIDNASMLKLGNLLKQLDGGKLTVASFKSSLRAMFSLPAQTQEQANKLDTMIKRIKHEAKTERTGPVTTSVDLEVTQARIERIQATLKLQEVEERAAKFGMGYYSDMIKAINKVKVEEQQEVDALKEQFRQKFMMSGATLDDMNNLLDAMGKESVISSDLSKKYKLSNQYKEKAVKALEEIYKREKEINKYDLKKQQIYEIETAYLAGIRNEYEQIVYQAGLATTEAQATLDIAKQQYDYMMKLQGDRGVFRVAHTRDEETENRKQQIEQLQNQIELRRKQLEDLEKQQPKYFEDYKKLALKNYIDELDKANSVEEKAVLLTSTEGVLASKQASDLKQKTDELIQQAQNINAEITALTMKPKTTDSDLNKLNELRNKRLGLETAIKLNGDAIDKTTAATTANVKEQANAYNDIKGFQEDINEKAQKNFEETAKWTDLFDDRLTSYLDKGLAKFKTFGNVAAEMYERIGEYPQEFSDKMSEGLTSYSLMTIFGKDTEDMKMLKDKYADLAQTRSELEAKMRTGDYTAQEAAQYTQLGNEMQKVHRLMEKEKSLTMQLAKAWKGFVDIVLEELQRYIAKMLVATAVQAGMDAAGEAIGGTLIDIFGIKTGGVVGELKTARFASGGVSGDIISSFSSGGVTGGTQLALIGDNPSKKEIVLPAEKIKANSTEGYIRDKAERTPQNITIVNTLSPQDIAAAISQEEGQKVIINTIGSDILKKGTTYRVIKDAGGGR